jgi:hypothetical protein
VVVCQPDTKGHHEFISTIPDLERADHPDPLEANGTVRWTRQSGTGDPNIKEWLRAVIVDASGQSHITGYTEGADASMLGSTAIDAILRSFSALGTLR